MSCLFVCLSDHEERLLFVRINKLRKGRSPSVKVVPKRDEQRRCDLRVVRAVFVLWVSSTHMRIFHSMITYKDSASFSLFMNEPFALFVLEV
jgi:hypothetical protein